MGDWKFFALKLVGFIFFLFNFENINGTQSIASTSNVPPPIFNLDRDSHHEYIGHLPLADLASVGRINKTLSPIAAEYYRDNFFARVRGKGGNIYIEFGEAKLNCFSKFVRRILMQDGDLSALKASRFNMLNEIEFYNGTLSFVNQTILTNIETLKFIFCKLNGELYDKFLSHSKNLKRLYVRDANLVIQNQNVIIGSSNDWLKKPYSTLEHFEIFSHRKFDEVIRFLEQNPKIQKLSVNIGFLLANAETLLKTNRKFKVLAISHTKSDPIEAINIVTQLQNRGFFEYLHLYFYTDAFDINFYATHSAKCIKLVHSTYFPNYLDPTALVNLEQLHLADIMQLGDHYDALENLQNLNYFHLLSALVEDFWSYIKNMPKLKQIQIDLFMNEDDFMYKNNVLDIPAINRERGNLPNAEKLTIFIPENVYLTTKKTFNETNYKFIELKRIASNDLNLDFAYGTDM